MNNQNESTYKQNLHGFLKKSEQEIANYKSDSSWNSTGFEKALTNEEESENMLRAAISKDYMKQYDLALTYFKNKSIKQNKISFLQRFHPHSPLRLLRLACAVAIKRIDLILFFLQVFQDAVHLNSRNDLDRKYSRAISPLKFKPELFVQILSHHPYLIKHCRLEVFNHSRLWNDPIFSIHQPVLIERFGWDFVFCLNKQQWFNELIKCMMNNENDSLLKEIVTHKLYEPRLWDIIFEMMEK